MILKVSNYINLPQFKRILEFLAHPLLNTNHTGYKSFKRTLLSEIDLIRCSVATAIPSTDFHLNSTVSLEILLTNQ